MYATKMQLKNELRNELQCPAEYIRHLSDFDFFDDLKEAVLADDRIAEADLIKEARQGYSDYCKDAGLDPETDNRRADPGYFIGLHQRKTNVPE